VGYYTYVPNLLYVPHYSLDLLYGLIPRHTLLLSKTSAEGLISLVLPMVRGPATRDLVGNPEVGGAILKSSLDSLL
jgi:hypothetical protein